jgi:acyl-CoA synthetase (AMP-forming)/AMP-acid ligase II
MTARPIPPLLPRISDYASWHAARQPHAIALSLRDVEVNYLELARRVDELACALLSAGVRKGDRVATLQTPHPDYLVAFVATASIGAIWLGLNPRYQLGELRRAVLDADPAVLLMRTVIRERRYDGEAVALVAASPGLRRLVVFDGDPLVLGAEPMQSFLEAGRAVGAAALESARSACGGRDPCLIVYTSGSSGTPKGALLHHEGIARASRAQNEMWPVDPFSIVNYFPINHVGCVVDCTAPCLIAGGTLHFMEQFDPRECLELMVSKRVTIWGSVPSAFQLQTELDDFDEFDLRAIQLIAWGGAAMSAALIERLLPICRRLCTNYGMTESCGSITAIEPTDDVNVLAHSVGHALPGVEVRLAKVDMNDTADGEFAGEVQVRSRCNLLSYWRRPDATAAAFTADGFLRTGDLAVVRPDGRYRLVGRLTDMYKSGGYNVYPREVERVLETHPAIAHAAVVPAPDPLWQEVGIAYVVTKMPVTATQLEAYCRTQLAAYKVPKRILIGSELPFLPIGKVDKRALRARAALLVQPSTDQPPTG